MIEIFDEDLNSVASHGRIMSRETHSTNQSHYPAEKLAVSQFSVQLALRDAEKIGTETERLVSMLLSGAYPLKYLRRVQGILRLYQSGRVTKPALEHACKMGLQFNKTQYAYIQGTAEYFDKSGNRPSVVRSAPIRDPNEIYLHNAIDPKQEET